MLEVYLAFRLVVQELSSAFIEEYGSLEEELAGKLFWAQGTITPVQIVEINIHHYEGHLEKIAGRGL